MPPGPRHAATAPSQRMRRRRRTTEGANCLATSSQVPLMNPVALGILLQVQCAGWPVQSVCKRCGRPATGPTYATCHTTSPGPRSRTHPPHSAYLHCKSALSSHSLPLLHCVSPINARICSQVRRAISPIRAYTYIFLVYLYIYFDACKNTR